MEELKKAQLVNAISAKIAEAKDASEVVRAALKVIADYGENRGVHTNYLVRD